MKSLLLLPFINLLLDLQMVDVTVRVLTKPKEKNLIKLYRTLSTDYDERVLPGIVNEILKSVIVSLVQTLYYEHTADLPVYFLNH